MGADIARRDERGERADSAADAGGGAERDVSVAGVEELLRGLSGADCGGGGGDAQRARQADLWAVGCFGNPAT